MTKRLFMDIHAIQTLPPSNMNRDDTGSPKTAQYGGVRRARVSSQAWKRAMRKYFEENSDAELGTRTTNIVDYVAGFIRKKDPEISEQEAYQKAKDIIEAVSKGGKKKEKAFKLTEEKDRDKKPTGKYTLSALFFLGKKQAEQLAEAALTGEKDPEKFHDIVESNPSVDIALFGRMLADDPSLNEDASAQVAHAISTHAVQTEFDFYSAVDDLAPKDNAGAGMLGTVEYNAPTLYRYANVAVHELLRQLDDKETTIRTVKLFAEAFVKSLPTGKVNTFANQTLPQAVLITLRGDRPVNLVSAFEEPVKSDNGYVRPSVERLFEELPKAEKFVSKPLLTLYLTETEVHADADGKEVQNMDEFLSELGSALDASL